MDNLNWNRGAFGDLWRFARDQDEIRALLPPSENSQKATSIDLVSGHSDRGVSDIFCESGGLEGLPRVVEVSWVFHRLWSSHFEMSHLQKTIP